MKRSLTLALALALSMLGVCTFAVGLNAREREPHFNTNVAGSALESLVYVSTNSAVNVYVERGHQQKPLAQITSGIVNPGGLSVSREGDLYVANGNGDILIYHRGAAAPYRKLTGVGSRAADVAVDANGSVFATEGTAGMWATTIAVFAPGSSKPTSQLDVKQMAANVAVTRNGDVFVQTYDVDQGISGIVEFKRGHPTPKALGIQTSSPGGIALDANDDLLVCDGGGQDGFSGSAAVYASPYTRGASPQFGIFDGIYGCAFGTSGTVWVAGNGNTGSALHFNGAGKFEDVIPIPHEFVHGITVD